MTNEEIAASRASIRKLQGYRKGSMPSLPQSLPQFIQDELGRKISPTIENLIVIIKALDARLTELERE